MSVAPLVIEIVFTFCLAAVLLYRYGNWFRHHIIVTLSVLTAWYFSLIIIFILPLDVSSTTYRQCLATYVSTTVSPPTTEHVTVHPDDQIQDSNDTATTISEPINVSTTHMAQVKSPCEEPWSYVPDYVLTNLWRVVYWTSQCLTWLIMPLMQSYSQAGEFTVGGKLRSSVIDNLIYYGTYLLICAVLLIYIAVKPELHLDGGKLMVIAASASNTWGLFLLVLLLGYGLVEVPRSLWYSAKRGHMLNYSYFKVAKLSTEKGEAEERVDDTLESVQIASDTIKPRHPLRKHLETVLQKIPVELQERMNRQRASSDSVPAEVPSEKLLVRLHKQVIRSLQTLQRTEVQWGMLVRQIIELEDVHRNEQSNERYFRSSFNVPTAWYRVVYTPTIEWYWKCVVRGYLLQVISMSAAMMSLFVVWSEVTFFNMSPVLSFFAKFVNMAKENYDYLSIEIISTATIAYLCACAYYTLFKIRVLNIYYLAPYHMTNEYSLIFSGMMLCRLTSPMCLNFLGLIHMDSHIIKEPIKETHFTQVMGHMDVISIISDGFNVYFPMTILVLCLASYFSLGSRILSLLGFQQFVGDDDITMDLVEEGRELIKREKRKRQRAEESAARKREFAETFGTSFQGARQRAEERIRNLRRNDSGESARAELLHDDPTDSLGGIDVYDTFTSQGGSTARFQTELETIGERRDMRTRMGGPPRNIFDDV